MLLNNQYPLQRQQLDLSYLSDSSYSQSSNTLVKTLGVSIVIPTFKRVSMCQNLLQSLEEASLELNRPFEVIIVDNSPRKEAQKIADLCSLYQAQYYHQCIGVGAKRNFGAKIAQYPIILFIDSDCEATPNLIKEHLACYEQNPQTSAVLGRTKFKGKKSFVWEVVNFTPFLVPFTLADNYGKQIWGPSNNFSIRKDVFKQVNGFNEKFPNKPGGEDVDLGYRLYEQGYFFITNPRATVYHTTETWNTWGQNIKRFFNWGKGEFYLYFNHDQHLYFDIPKGSLITFIFVIISLGIAAWQFSANALIIPLIFIVVNYLSRIVLHIIYNPSRLNQIVKVVMAELFVIVYEWGLTCECFSQGWFLPLFHRLIVQQDQTLKIWNQQVIYTWITFLQIALTLGLWEL